MSTPERPDRAHSIEDFYREPPPTLAGWRWLWEADRPFPVRTSKTGLRRLVTLVFKYFVRLIRPLVKALLGDLHVRQIRYNVVLLDYMEEHRARLAFLEATKKEGFDDVNRHTDTLFALLDQKLDRYRRESQQLWNRLNALVAQLQESGQGGEAFTEQVARMIDEGDYLELENRFRGSQADISERVTAYLPYLDRKGEVLDLGCGRGEALAVLREHGLSVRGVDSSEFMVGLCQEQGLDAEVGDLFEVLVSSPEESLGAIVSFHVIEHLPAEAAARLVRLAWRALEPGGVLILESPNPLSLVVAARNFWLDPTHIRPIHPETLKLTFEVAGFDLVEQLDFRPFTAAERLPEIPIDGLSEDLLPLADQVNRIRDKLDRLLFGFQDFAIVGTKPE